MGASDPTVQVELSGGNHHTRRFIPPEIGHQYILEMNPTSEFVKHQMEKMKEPSVMLLRGCDQLSLESDFSWEKLKTLTVVEISGFSNLMTALPDQSISLMIQLQHLNLSHLPIQQLQHDLFSNLENLRSLVLRGCSNLQSLPDLPYMDRLEFLDLSHLPVESVGFISGMVHLRHLILQRCTNLITLPELKKLTELELLDLSGCEMLGDLPEDVRDLKKLKELSVSGCTSLQELREGIFDEMGCLEKLDLSKTEINHLPSFANLTNLQTLTLSHTFVEQMPDLSNLLNLRVFFQGNENGVVDLIQGRISQANELHLVSTFITDSRFDKLDLDSPLSDSYLDQLRQDFDLFRQHFDGLVGMISKIQDSLKLISPCDSTLGSNSTAASFDINSDTFTAHYRAMLVDLQHIFHNIDSLERSPDRASAGHLLVDLTNAATRLSASDFTIGSIHLEQLVLTISKLKVLVPIPKVREDEWLWWQKMKNTQSNPLRDESINSPAESMLEEDDMRCWYDSLKEIQLRNCLLYLSAFPCRDGRLIIKERVLIQLWYGEGFIDGVIEDVGRNILMLLRDKGFINKQMGVFGQTTFWCMVEQVHTFVRKRAEEEAFFDFDHCKTTRDTPDLRGSTRACLLRSKDNNPSSCKLWEMYSRACSEKLKRFETMRTLLNADETAIEIRGKWFSKMTNLNVLHIGRWFYYQSEFIDVMDLEFLKELKRMKQLRLLSLEGFPTLTKLPDSVCKVTNLKILSLRGCGYLDQIPTDIGSLKNLTHLDLTYCHSLYMLPKGLRLLSKLEVLKGFLISYQIGGGQRKDACTLTDLLRLRRLRILKLCVNKNHFPSTQDLQVFKKMTSLYNLKITWQLNNSKALDSDDVIGQEMSRQPRFPQLKCWDVTKELSRNDDHLDNLKKLKLFCFPLEIAPDWFDPSEMRNLEKLSIVGGRLETLVGRRNENEWNVKSLCLRHMQRLEMDWEETRKIFPHMKYLNIYECERLSSFPCDSFGVVEIHSEED